MLAAVAIALVAWLIEDSVGWPVDAIVIATIVLLNGVLGYVQEAKADDAVVALVRMTAATSAVRRDGRGQGGQQAESAIGRCEQDRPAVRTRVGLIKGRGQWALDQVRKQYRLCYRRLVQRRRLLWEKARVVTALYHVEAFVFPRISSALMNYSG